ncbi:hypothetical protein VTK73DRAFT_3134 [Phialemonium thermophilum]|uniref:Uncharacterized protein n=1 Tax=Phialemonium thermophilum TaxID=223376 RepID=A0ABR3X198_9PEZI
MISDFHDIPPPPYSETDIYSVSGSAPSLPGRPTLRTSSHGGSAVDDVASPGAPASATTSSTSAEVIHTPPLTPHSSHQSVFGPAVSDHLTTSSALLYFESRPSLSFHPGVQLVHCITVLPTSVPADFPYPSWAAARDVLPEDWQTFVNYLLPHHPARSNAQVIDRKLQAEGSEEGQGNGKARDDDGNEDEDDLSSHRGRGPPSHAEQQLHQLRPTLEDGLLQRRHDIEDTVREWNDGFFAPRGITINLNPVDLPRPSDVSDDLHIPGAWDQSFDHNVEGDDAGNVARGGIRGRFNPFASGRGGDSRGFRFAGVAVEGDRVSIGNTFVADRNGVRIGGITADGNGISVHGTPLFGAGVHHRHHAPHNPHHHNVHFSGPPRCGGRGGAGRGFGIGFGPFGGGPAAFAERDFGSWGHRGGGPGFRGRGRDRVWDGDRKHGSKSRSSSVSSSSSSISSSSTSSVSSVGSLPDHDHLRESQLSIAKRYLEEWLNHPEQPITKESVKSAKEQIKAARNDDKQQKPAVAAATAKAQKEALRREVKSLQQRCKELKRQQKQQARERKRQNRQIKRERRNARRAARRERKKAKREAKREAKRAQRQAKRDGGATAALAAVAAAEASSSSSSQGPPTQPPFPFGGPPAYGYPPWLRHQQSPAGPIPYGPATFLGRFAGRGFGPEPFWQQPPSASSSSPIVPPGPVPGAWNSSTEGVETYPASLAKYRAAEELERQVMAKEEELRKVHEQLVQEDEARRTSCDPRGDEKAALRGQLSAERIELEIEDLQRDLERLRVEADAEFARELAEEETRQHA